MESTPQSTTAPPASESPARPMSPWERTIAIFLRPTQAWSGLERKSQWWFPVLITIVVVMACTILVFDRAIVPMQLEQMQAAVDQRGGSAEEVERVESFLRSPAGLAIGVVPIVIFLPIATLIAGLLIWFGVGFVLGTRMRFGLAVAVAAWSSLITLPAQVLMSLLAWFQETMKVHVGFGALVPMDDPPSKLQTFLGAFLDAVGPLSIWYLAVMVIGASALSRAPRRSVAWVLGGIYVAVSIFLAAMGAMFAPGS